MVFVSGIFNLTNNSWFLHFVASMSLPVNGFSYHTLHLFLPSPTDGAAMIFFTTNFYYHLMPLCDSNPRNCTRLGPLKDALLNELQHPDLSTSKLVGRETEDGP